MPLCVTTSMLLEAQEKRVAIGAFNVENMEMAKAVVDVSDALGVPVILQTTPSTLKYAGPHVFWGMAAALAKTSKSQIALHLDHGSSLELVKEALDVGYTSVMYDGSLLGFAENVGNTRKAVELAGQIPVEAELGSVGGKEDDHEAENAYTDPDEAREFVEKTGVGSLAIAIGTAHGVYKGEPKLDIARLVEIKKRVNVPLVLHGASGLSKEVLRTCIREGISKVNFATELRIAYSQGVKEYLAKNPDVIDPKTFGKAGYEAVKQTVKEKLDIIGVI